MVVFVYVCRVWNLFIKSEQDHQTGVIGSVKLMEGILWLPAGSYVARTKAWLQ